MRFFTTILFTLAIGAGLIFAWEKNARLSSLTYNSQAFKHQFIIVQAHQLLGFNLVDPEQAPSDIRDSVMRGYRLFMNTHYYAPSFALNQIDCVNCHFSGGDTLGGKNGGISLVGVTTVYPQFSKRAGKVITLQERINNCFQRSMNGNPIPVNSWIMRDLLNYLGWISKEVETIKDIPWLGLPEIKNDHKPNPEEGKKLYMQYCAACHQADGSGGGEISDLEGKTIPPLWGSHSFNDGAGMNTIRMLAPFIYLNMPYQQARLTEEQSLDLAEFIIGQNRPKFQKK